MGALTRTRVMVTGTGQLGVGEGIVQCLDMAPANYSVVAANSNFHSASLFSSDVGLVLPGAHETSYLGRVLQACADYGVEFLVPGSEPELRILLSHADELRRLGCILLANEASVVAVGDDKMRSCHFLESRGIPTPRSSADLTRESAEQLGYPLILKPYLGGGSKNVFTISSPEELDLVCELMAIKGVSVFIQEYVGSPEGEYTASALMSPGGTLIGSFAARRTLAGGASGTVIVEDFPEVRRVAEEVAIALNATGPINIQARSHKGRICVFEINPRFSGSAPFRAMCGFNEPHLAIQAALGKPTDYLTRVGVLGIRCFRQVLIPENRVFELPGVSP